MNWKLAVLSMLVVLTVLNLAEGALGQTLKGVYGNAGHHRPKPSLWRDCK